MNKVLITGINGFIGHNMADFMLSKGYEVWGTYRNNIKYYNPQITYIQCDLGMPLQINERFDVIIHAASQVENSNTYDYIVNTVTATNNILKYCEQTEAGMFIYMSSIAVYGETSIEINEHSDKININMYAMAKLFAESIVSESDIQTKIILRLPRVLGRGVNINHQWIPALVYNLSNNKDITYFNPGLDYNNLMDVNDLSVFVDHLIHTLYGLQVNEIILLGAAQKMKIIDIINYFKIVLDSKSKLIKLPDRKTTAFSIDISKAVQFGYKPRDIKEILERFTYCV
jgi:Nucleoside-diphosphate-sugar epimerases